MYVHFTKTKKRLNSTINPFTVGDAGGCECVLKDGCSVQHPTLQLRLDPSEVALFNSYNYAKIDDFNRSYFVTEWKYNQPFWECSLSVDVLVSFYDDFINSVQYVARAEQRVDASVVDDAAIVTAGHEYGVATGGKIFTTGYTNGFYILTVVNSEPDVGATKLYAFHGQGRLEALQEKLWESTDWLDITDISSDLVKGLLNPIQHVVSCRFYPLDISDSVDLRQNASGDYTNLQYIKLGFWSTNVWAFALTKFDAKAQSVLDVPKHPQAADSGEYLNISPYSRYTLEFEPFGVIPIDSTVLSGEDTIYLDVEVDLVSGGAALTVTGSEGSFIAKRYAQVGIDVSISQAAPDVLSSASAIFGSAVGGTVSAVSGNAIGAVGSVVSGIGNAAVGALPQVAVKGGDGSRVFMDEPPRLHADFKIIKDCDAAICGKPVCESRRLGDFSGFVQCQNPVINSGATMSESESIAELLTGGVYIE